MKKNFAPPSGTRDFLPNMVRRRLHFIKHVREIFDSYGFEPLETPSFERWNFLTGKLGDEGEQLLFKILRRGTELEDLRLGKAESVQFSSFDDAVDMALRYDLTVPFSRVMAGNQFPMPFKRYQIQPVWRADRAQKGRYREFYQCDMDIAGVSSVTADAEIFTIAYRALESLQLENFLFRLNHRKVINGLIAKANAEEFFQDITVTVDKLDKIGPEGVEKELKKKNVPEETIRQLLEWMSFEGSYDEVCAQLQQWLEGHEEGLTGVEELLEIKTLLLAHSLDLSRFKLDLFLMRGLDYYTGPICEVIDTKVDIGSIASGGRYDKLIGKFSGKDIPCTGMTLGMERILDVLEEYGKVQESSSSADVFVSVFHKDNYADSLAFAQRLRETGLRVETPLKLQKLPKQIKYASRKHIPVIAILGPDEIEKQEVVLRTGPKDQETLSQENAATWIQAKLREIS